MHLEVKSGARLYAPRALEQAKRDAGGFPAAVFYQPFDLAPWIVALEAVDFLELLEFVAREGTLFLAMFAPGHSVAPAGDSPTARGGASAPFFPRAGRVGTAS